MVVGTPVVEKVRQLLTPRSIALVGATENSFWSRTIINNLNTLGFTGDLYLVHPKQKEQFGRPCYPSVTAIPGEVDHAYVMTGTQHAMSVLRDCAAKGVGGVTMLTAGFKETDAAGAERQAELVEFCREHDLPLLGPNCLGFVNARQPVPAFALHMGEAPLPGHVGILLQSGALLNHVHRLARTRNIGLTYLISSGNEAVLDAADFLSFLVEDPDTKVVGALVEGIRRPAAFAAAAERAIVLGKPMVVLKTGRSEGAARAAVAHTAALTGADAVADAFLKQLGVIRVTTVEDLVETCGFLQAYGWPMGRRAGVVTPSGGSCGVISDLCATTAIELPDFGAETKAKLKEILPEFGTPQNPMDTTGVIVLDATLIPKTATVVSADPDLDLLVIVQDPPRDPGVVPSRNDERMKFLADTIASSPKYACAIQTVASELTIYGRELAYEYGVFFGNGLTLGVSALDRAIRYGEARQRILQRHPSVSLSGTSFTTSSETDRQTLNEARSKDLLREYGIPTVRERIARDADEASRVSDELGYPVVLKILAADVPHKTEAGGVALNLRSADEVRGAYTRVVESVRRYKPDAAIEGVLVAEQVSDGIEMIAGITVDPVFGPVVVCGLGGIFVEVLRDVAMRLPPFDNAEALAMIGELRGKAILDGVRGRPAADIPALAETLVRLSHLSRDLGDRLVELDVNPLFVLPAGRGVRAADALVVLRE